MMRKIANPTELRTEVQKILAYSQTHQPSRERIASSLHNLSQRVASSAAADAVLDKVERQLKSKFSTLHFDRFVEEEVGLSLSIEPKDRDPDSSVVIVHVSEDGDSSGVSAHHYGSGSSSSEGPDFNGADASKLTPAATKLIEKYIARGSKQAAAGFKAGDSIVLSKDIYGGTKDGFTEGERVTVRGAYKGPSGDMVVLRSGKGVLLHMRSEDVPGEADASNKSAGKMDDIAPGLKGLAQRQVDAANKFIEYCQEHAKLGRDDAKKVLAYYLKHKLMKLDSVTGDFKVKHGAYLDADVLKRAVDA